MWDGDWCASGGGSRTDRQDMMVLIAGYLDLEFTVVDAVRLHPIHVQ